MRNTPAAKYLDKPCSYVGVGCAYEDLTGKDFDLPLPDGLRDDGWLTLDNLNRFVRSVLPIRKKQYFRRKERLLLEDFIGAGTGPCVICVYGHFIYAKGGDYWSFFDNDMDPVVCVWYIDEKEVPKC